MSLEFNEETIKRIAKQIKTEGHYEEKNLGPFSTKKVDEVSSYIRSINDKFRNKSGSNYTIKVSSHQGGEPSRYYIDWAISTLEWEKEHSEEKEEEKKESSLLDDYRASLDRALHGIDHPEDIPNGVYLNSDKDFLTALKDDLDTKGHGGK